MLLRGWKWIGVLLALFCLFQVVNQEKAYAFAPGVCGTMCMAQMNSGVMGAGLDPFYGTGLMPMNGQMPMPMPMTYGQMPTYYPESVWNGGYYQMPDYGSSGGFYPDPSMSVWSGSPY